MNRLIAVGLLSIIVASSTFAAVVVENRRDELVLKNGEKVRCTVVANGHMAVVVVVDDEEKVYSRSEVRYIKKGEVTFNLRAYGTKRVEGLDVISGEAEEDLEGEGDLVKKPKKNTAGKKKTSKKAAPKSNKRRPLSNNSKKKSTGKKSNTGGKVSASQIQNAMKQFPMAREYVQKNGGVNNVMKMLNANPALLKQIQGYMGR